MKPVKHRGPKARHYDDDYADLDAVDLQILTMRLAGRSAEEIGKSIGISRVSVNKRISANHILRKHIREHGRAALSEAQGVFRNNMVRVANMFVKIALDEKAPHMARIAAGVRAFQYAGMEYYLISQSNEETGASDEGNLEFEQHTEVSEPEEPLLD